MKRKSLDSNVIFSYFLICHYCQLMNSFQREMREERRERKPPAEEKAGSADIGNRVLISSLPPSMSEKKLKQLMQSVGEVEVSFLVVKLQFCNRGCINISLWHL